MLGRPPDAVIALVYAVTAVGGLLDRWHERRYGYPIRRRWHQSDRGQVAVHPLLAVLVAILAIWSVVVVSVLRSPALREVTVIQPPMHPMAVPVGAVCLIIGAVATSLALPAEAD